MRSFWTLICAAVLCASSAAAQPRLESRFAGPLRPDGPRAASGGGFYLEGATPNFALSLPTGVAVGPAGDMYVAQKNGAVRLVRADGTVLPEPVVDLDGEVVTDGDRGLTGLALHPGFPATPYLYLLYPVDDIALPPPASLSRGYSRLVRYSLSPGGTSVVPGSRRVLLGETSATGIVSCYNSHSAGTLRFGHDGSLLVSHGDGASWADVDAGGLYPECFDGTGIDPALDVGAYRALTTRSLAGKILRVDPETGLGLPDNPFYDGDPSSSASRVWALGLRNPFRFALAAVDPDNPEGPGQLVVGDVGWAAFEELNVVTGGENFGWPCFEGPRVTFGYDTQPPPSGIDCQSFEGTLTSARAYFHHYASDASAPAGRIASSITGGVFYPGEAYPERFRDMLFFADYAFGWIAAGRVGPDGLEASEQVLDGAGAIVDLAYDATQGVLVGVDIGRGRLVRLLHTGDGSAPPVARGVVSERYGEVVHTVSFSDDGSFDPGGGALSYRWSFGTGDGADGPEATYSYAVPGTYVATLAVTNEAGRTASTTVPVSVGESLPTLSIVRPTSSFLPPSGGVELELEASDRRGEVLDTFWEIDLLHNAHIHPSFHALDVAQGTVSTEPHAGPGEVAYYRARAVVVDEEGLRVERSVPLVSTSLDELSLGTGAAGPSSTVTFAHPLEVGRLHVSSDSGHISEAQVQVFEGGEWVPARSVRTLRIDSVDVVLLASVTTTGVRLVGQNLEGAALEAVVRIPLESDLPGAWDPVDAGGAEGGRTVPFGDAGLALVGTGSFASGAYHTARQPLTGDGVVVARLDALDGGADAFAGVAMHTDLGAGGTGLAIGRSVNGTVRVWKRLAGVATEATVHAEGAAWYRIRREAGRLIAEVSRDSLDWVQGASVEMPDEVVLVAGPAVAGGARPAVAWFDQVLLTSMERPGRPLANVFRVSDVFPNPGRGQATFVIEAGVPGTYSAQVLDSRGRVLMQLPTQVVGDDPERFERTLSRDALAQGVYYVRIRNEDSGDTRLLQFVTVR